MSDLLSYADPDYAPITPNLLIFGRNLRMSNHSIIDIKLNDPKFRTYKNLIIKLKNKLGNIKISLMIILIKSKVKSKSLVLLKLTNSFNCFSSLKNQNKFLSSRIMRRAKIMNY